MPELKSCNLPLKVAVSILEQLNPDELLIKKDFDGVAEKIFFLCDVNTLFFPEGWFFQPTGRCHKNGVLKSRANLDGAGLPMEFCPIIKAKL